MGEGRFICEVLIIWPPRHGFGGYLKIYLSKNTISHSVSKERNSPVDKKTFKKDIPDQQQQSSVIIKSRTSHKYVSVNMFKGALCVGITHTLRIPYRSCMRRELYAYLSPTNRGSIGALCVRSCMRAYSAQCENHKRT